MPHPARTTARTVARSAALALVSSLLVLGGGLSTPAGAVAAKAEVHPEWGRTFKKDGVLKFSCRNYAYRYAITPPEGEWALETFLVGPGRSLALTDGIRHGAWHVISAPGWKDDG